ncbi:MAG: alkaline phosphatase family protein [Chloroflexi bacterium]|nr:alkaline phosphatase family protein [Chloroflexota bacterium]
MTTTEAERALAPPERLAGQGLDSNQEESGNRAIHALLTDSLVGPQTDLVITYRDGAYEVWAQRGMVRFQRTFGEGGHEYHVVETIGENPIENQDVRALATIEEELEAARLSGQPTDDANRAFVEPAQLSYPLAYERIAQLFDSPNAPDLVLNPKTYAYKTQPGQHGALDIIQSRAPLIFSGPGVRPGVSDGLARHIDIAPTIAKLLGLPLIEGRDATGRPSSDVYLKRQDGRPLDEILDTDGNGNLNSKPERVYLLHMDGQSATELYGRLEKEPDSLPNLRRLTERGHRLRYGSIVNFPSITWPSHNVIGTGCWSGHHDLVNNNYYIRETRELVSPYDERFETAKYLGDEVETLHEALHRAFGAWQGHEGAFTAAIHEPCSRDADHTVLERRTIGDRDRLRAVTREAAPDSNERWGDEGYERLAQSSMIDNRGIAQAIVLFTDDTHPPPIFTYHQFMTTDGAGHDFGPHHEVQREALDEVDRRIGRILRTLEERGLFDSTLFIIAADHGMAAVDTELAADQISLLARDGFKAVTTECWAYLLDMAVEIDKLDNGVVGVTVRHNDADTSGEHPPVADVSVKLSGRDDRELARARTGADGVIELSLPADVPMDDIVVTVQHDDFNLRHLRLDGTSIAPDLRELLYGAARGGAQ